MTVRPWHIADEHDRATKPLVLHTPSNAYRLDFLRAMFPNARLRVIHLTRNPAASINGLFDGWRHPGFYAHRMTQPLHITGYTDARPQDRCWWKFDLPPGWHHYTQTSLMSVCAFQWRSAHQAALDGLADDTIDRLQIRHEDLISSPQSRIHSLTRLSQWLDVPLAGSFRHAVHAGIPPVVSTAPPSARRWHRRAADVQQSWTPTSCTSPAFSATDLKRTGFDRPPIWDCETKTPRPTSASSTSARVIP